MCSVCSPPDCFSRLSSAQEAARYLETYKVYESKPADLLKEKIDNTYLARVCGACCASNPESGYPCVCVVSVAS